MVQRRARRVAIRAYRTGSVGTFGVVRESDVDVVSMGHLADWQGRPGHGPWDFTVSIDRGKGGRYSERLEGGDGGGLTQTCV